MIGTALHRPNAAGKSVVSIANDGNDFCLVTTLGAHGKSVSNSVTIAGNSVAGYNTTHTITDVPNTTSFATNKSYTSAGTGGSWS